MAERHPRHGPDDPDMGSGVGPGFGGLAELLVDPSGEILDLWPIEMAIPGFIGGAAFAGLILFGERHRRFDEVSLAPSSLDVVTGVILGLLSSATGGPIPLSLAAAQMVGLAVALGAVAAIGSAMFFRLLVWRQASEAA